MNEVMTKSIGVTYIHRVLEQLLNTYQEELDESLRDDDTYFMQYWDSARQTIYDVAAALNIPFEEKQDTKRPHRADSMTVLDSADVHLFEGKTTQSGFIRFPDALHQ